MSTDKQNEKTIPSNWANAAIELLERIVENDAAKPQYINEAIYIISNVKREHP